MGKIKSDTLKKRVQIMVSDEDQPIVTEIYVGFDGRNNLVVSVDNLDYESPEFDCSTWVTVRRDEVAMLAKRLRIKKYNLPQFIAYCMSEWREIVNPTGSQVKDCFKEITECFLDEGCHFRVGRTSGPRIKKDRYYVCC